MKVSILIAAHQAEPWLAACVESVRQQALAHPWQLEILLGVDGCPSTLEAARLLDRERLTILHSSENTGPFVMFNTLMLYASGDVICRFDADDVMAPSYLYEQIERLLVGVDMTLAWSIFVDEGLRPLSRIPTRSDLCLHEGRYEAGTEGQVVMRRRVWDRLGGFQPWRCGADTDFYIRAQTMGLKIQTVRKFLYFRRIHMASLTVHPDTNRKSRLRKDVEATLKTYVQEYRLSKRPLKIEPVTTSVVAV